MTATGDVLIAAVKQFDEHGWCTGSLKNKAGEMCAVGALMEVIGHPADFRQPVREVYGLSFLELWEDPLYQNALHALRRHIPGDFSSGPPWMCDDDDGCWVVKYNNTRTSYAEIREWFEKAAMDEGVSL